MFAGVRPTSLLSGDDLGPVGVEGGHALVGQGVLEALLERAERDGGDVGAHERALRDVVGAAHGGGDDLDLLAVGGVGREVVVVDGGDDVADLLEAVLLQADYMELKANKKTFASGYVLEAKLDKGRGSVATVLVTRGTLRVGDTLVAGLTYGRVRAMLNDKGEPMLKYFPLEGARADEYSMAFPKGSELTPIFNEALAQLKESGKLDEMIHQWLY